MLRAPHPTVDGHDLPGAREGLAWRVQAPSGRRLSVFASALVTGSPEFPLSEIPFQAIVDRVATGTYHAKPAKVFRFEEIQDAHRLMESNQAKGKIVVTL
jgi:NADPH2:quinone reductase